MTDQTQTKQRMAQIDLAAEEHLAHISEQQKLQGRALDKICHATLDCCTLEFETMDQAADAILARAAQREAASAAAALRMAAHHIQKCQRDGMSNRGILAQLHALITPEASSALSAFEARVRDDALEEAARAEDAEAAEHHANSRWELAALHNAAAVRIRALKSGSHGNG